MRFDLLVERLDYWRDLDVGFWVKPPQSENTTGWFFTAATSTGTDRGGGCVLRDSASSPAAHAAWFESGLSLPLAEWLDVGCLILPSENILALVVHRQEGGELFAARWSRIPLRLPAVPIRLKIGFSGGGEGEIRFRIRDLRFHTPSNGPSSVEPE